jgi:two-component system chemotaxis response regulator CheB
VEWRVNNRAPEGRYMPARDIIVIAGSAGAVREMRALVGGLPADFSGSVFVVLHTSADGPGFLAQVLGRAGPLPVEYPQSGASIRPGHIYVAPPNYHLLIDDSHATLGMGPRENGFRPAADPLFRSAAEAYDGRVVGIVLSGGMDDGTLGLQVIKDRGGIAIVQNPDEALYRGMPESALRSVAVDHVMTVDAMPDLLVELSRNGSPKGYIAMKTPHKQTRDTAITGDIAGPPPLEGPPSTFICPDCGGPLWEFKNGRVLHYRCHVGHAYTAESLVAGQDDATEEALWTALRTLEETAALRRRMADDARSRNLVHVAVGYEERAHQIEQRAGVIRKVLLSDNLPQGFKGYGTSEPAKFLSREARKTSEMKNKRKKEKRPHQTQT